MRAETTSETTGPDIVRWRREQLTATGFGLPLAAEVAKDTRYDLHELIQLVERGCRPELAVRILAPLEWDSAA